VGYWSTGHKVSSPHVKSGLFSSVLGFELWLGLVFDDHECACTTSVVIATFLRFAGDELTVFRFSTTVNFLLSFHAGAVMMVTIASKSCTSKCAILLQCVTFDANVHHKNDKQRDKLQSLGQNEC